jgi:hypothetical protein
MLEKCSFAIRLAKGKPSKIFIKKFHFNLTVLTLSYTNLVHLVQSGASFKAKLYIEGQAYKFDKFCCAGRHRINVQCAYRMLKLKSGLERRKGASSLIKIYIVKNANERSLSPAQPEILDVTD